MRHAAPSRRADPPAISIESVRWERIQLTISARVARGSLEPEAVALHRHGALGGTVPPTWSSLDGDRLDLRFNVMLGPGQLPLQHGRWLLSYGHERKPLPLTNGSAECLPAPREFTLKRSLYRVAALADPKTHALALDVLETPTVGGRPQRGVAGRVRGAIQDWRPTTRVRRSMFMLLVRVFDTANRHDGKRILFTSDSRHGLTGNLQLVHDRMIERGLDGEYDIATVFKPSVVASRSWRDRFRLPYLFARADVIVMDDYQPAVYNLEPSPRRRIVQLWHASGAFKTVGYSRVGKPGAPDPYSRIHKNYTYAIVSAACDVPYYAEAFGLPEDRIIPTGMPRIDRFFDEARRARALAEAAAAFPQIAGRRVILFAPTFRGEDAWDAHYAFDRLDYAALHALCVEKDAVVIIRMHPFVREPLAIPEPFVDRLVDGSHAHIDVNDLLFAVDLLVTDYSSIIYEFATLGRPMVFFAYDLEEYLATRDLYVRYEEFVPGRIVRTFEELLAAVRCDDFEAARVPVFARQHLAHLDGSSTDRVIDDVILRR